MKNAKIIITNKTWDKYDEKVDKLVNLLMMAQDKRRSSGRRK